MAKKEITLTEKIEEAIIVLTELKEGLEGMLETAPAEEKATPKRGRSAVKEEKPAAKEEKKSTKKEAPPEEDDEVVLTELSLAQLKKLARENELNDKGTKDELIERLQAELGGGEEAEGEEEVDLDEILAQLSDDELKAVLEDNGIAAKGKRSILENKFKTAAEAGKIDLEALFEGGDDAEFDLEYFTGEDNTTEERQETIDAIITDTDKKIGKNKLTTEKMLEVIQEHDMLSVEDEDDEDEVRDTYLLVRMLYVDDEGEEHKDGEAYSILDTGFCCGHPLEEKDDGFVCTVCGSVYEAE